MGGRGDHAEERVVSWDEGFSYYLTSSTHRHHFVNNMDKCEICCVCTRARQKQVVIAHVYLPAAVQRDKTWPGVKQMIPHLNPFVVQVVVPGRKVELGDRNLPAVQHLRG